MSYKDFLWRRANPEKNYYRKKKQHIRAQLRKRGILPPKDQPMNEEQQKIDDQISNADFSYWDALRGGPKKRTSSSKKPINKSLESIICLRAKHNAKSKGLEFDLEESDIELPEYCPLLGVKLLYDIDDNQDYFYHTIDRIDSTLGYIRGNIQIISRLANTMKSNATVDQLLTFATNVLEQYNTKSLIKSPVYEVITSQLKLPTYVKLIIYRNGVSLYYSSGNGNSYRRNLGIKLNHLNEEQIKKVESSFKKHTIPDELLNHKDEITSITNYANNKISSFKIKNGRKPTVDEFRQMMNSKKRG